MKLFFTSPNSKMPILAAGLLCLNMLSLHAENLVPTTPNTAPDYFSTWNAQYYQVGVGKTNFDCHSMITNGNQLAQDIISQQVIFGSTGWAKSFHAKARGDLYFVLDDGAFIGTSAAIHNNNSFILDPARFSSFPNSSATSGSQWKTMNDSIKALGWRGVGIWCRDPESNYQFPIVWCKNAGIEYWKIDGGGADMRQEAMRQANNYPQLIMEHMPANGGPMNGDGSSSNNRFGAQSWGQGTIDLMTKVDIVRTYDIINAFSGVSSIDRVSELLKGVNGHPEVTCKINVEDEAYIAAGLGCLMGVMRHSMNGQISPDCDVGFLIKPGSRLLKKRMDEIVRTVRWHRIAPPFGAGLYTTLTDANALTDSYTFTANETWMDFAGQTKYQGAYAKVARGLPLPTVTKNGTTDDSLPFILASKYPSGAVSIAAIGRCKPANSWFIPRADVVLDVSSVTGAAGALAGPFGIFGEYKSLKINFSQLPTGAKVLAQDLMGDAAADITSRVTISGNDVTIPGAVISEIGLSAKTAGDLSDPGMVLVVRTSTSTAFVPQKHVQQRASSAKLAMVDRTMLSAAGIVNGSTPVDLVDIRGRKVAYADKYAKSKMTNGVYITQLKNASFAAKK